MNTQSRRIWERMKATFLCVKEAFTLTTKQRRHLHKTVLEIDEKLRQKEEHDPLGSP